MSENNKSYRIRTDVGSNKDGYINLDLKLLQDYDIFEILSLKIETEGVYHLQTSKYGCLVGRVLANGGVGIPNAKVSVFIGADAVDLSDPVFSYLYPYTNTKTQNRDYIRYNLLTDQKIDNCHQDIGTFPNKRLVLDDNNYIEIFDKYYKYTTTTNGSGDYMIFGLPVGNNIIHTDLDLSDIGMLSQKPRDLFYKGYSVTQFENASQFKKDTNLDNLTQVFSQDSSVYVYPFWGDESENGDQIKITRNDVNISYKFEPTCIFIGSIVSDEKSNAISKNCIPHERMGKMDRLTTGHGTIEMIRKTMAGNVESIAIQGNELIDGNGTWCYQIPMNLDYVKTNEYGELVPTNDTDNGIPTRARVRFRVSLSDYESDYDNSHLVKVLVPNNPTVTEIKEDGKVKDRKINYDYEFGTNTLTESYRDLFWNNVYTVKQYIPRIQKGNRQRNKNFTGFKAVNVNGSNNPIPYNNMRINLTFLFVFQCLIFKTLVMIVKIMNKIIYLISGFGCGAGCAIPYMSYITLDGGMCPNLEGNYIAPGSRDDTYKGVSCTKKTYEGLFDGDDYDGSSVADTGETNTNNTNTAYDPHAADSKNANYVNISGSTHLSDKYLDDDNGEEDVKIYKNEDYFMKCVELQFALEYEVIQFDFYNDWINGLLYIPRWFAEARKNKDGMVYCGESFGFNRNLVQQCALGYATSGNSILVTTEDGCSGTHAKQRCHKGGGRKAVRIFGPKNRGIVERLKTSKGHYAYYLRPSEASYDTVSKKINLFATDLVLMGSVNECNQYGLPTVNGYSSSSYIMPPPTGELVYGTQEMELVSGQTGEITTANAYYSTRTYQLSFNTWYTENAKIGSVDDSGRTLVFFESGFYNFPALSDDLRLTIIEPNSGMAIGPFEAENITNSSNNKSITLKTDLTEIQKDFAIGSNVLFTSKYHLYTFNKQAVGGTTYDDGEKVIGELAGIDWGYDPYRTGSTDNTMTIVNQNTGHFLEIGCTYSLSNVKSCVNLTRICEIGSEMSQSHYYGSSDSYVRPAGLIGKREVINDGIRTTFATLNSNGLKTVIDTNTGYLRYDLNGYIPNSFMGELGSKITSGQWSGLTSDEFGYIEGQTKSYKAFRFGTIDLSSVMDSKFLLNTGKSYYMPQYENSFYFYFGLKDGSTAIDRLYSEYYAECTTDNEDEEIEPSLTLMCKISSLMTAKGYGVINYEVKGLGNIDSSMFKIEHYSTNTKQWSEITNYALDIYKKEIRVNSTGRYRVTITNNKNVSVSSTVIVVTAQPTPIGDIDGTMLSGNTETIEGRIL